MSIQETLRRVPIVRSVVGRHERALKQKDLRDQMLRLAGELGGEGIADIRVYEEDYGGGFRAWRLFWAAQVDKNPPSWRTTHWVSYGIALVETLYERGKLFVYHSVRGDGWQEVEKSEDSGSLSVEDRLKRARERAQLMSDDCYESSTPPIQRPVRYRFEKRIL